MAEHQTDHRLSEQQQALLQLMKWFDGYCRKHHLRYYAVGGTMLGAVRHGGFIPWDDDLDVGMPRADYIRFLKLRRREQERAGLYLAKGSKSARRRDVPGLDGHEERRTQIPRYVVEYVQMGNRDYLFPHAKVFDTTTTLVERKSVPVRRGIYLDLFPLDGLGDSLKEAKARFAWLAIRLDVLATRVCAPRRDRSWGKNVAIFAARLIPSVFYQENKKMCRIDRACMRLPYDESIWVANIYGIKREREIMPRVWFSDPTEYPFEDMKIYGPAQYEPYLTALFGQWRELPPLAQQQTHHDYLFCDLKHSWLEE